MDSPSIPRVPSRRCRHWTLAHFRRFAEIRFDSSDTHARSCCDQSELPTTARRTEAIRNNPKRRRVYRGNTRLLIEIKYEIVEIVVQDTWIYIVCVVLWRVIDKRSNGTANIVLLSCHEQQLSSRKCSKQSV